MYKYGSRPVWTSCHSILAPNQMWVLRTFYPAYLVHWMFHSIELIQCWVSERESKTSLALDTPRQIHYLALACKFFLVGQNLSGYSQRFSHFQPIRNYPYVRSAFYLILTHAIMQTSCGSWPFWTRSKPFHAKLYKFHFQNSGFFWNCSYATIFISIFSLCVYKETEDIAIQLLYTSKS